MTHNLTQNDAAPAPTEVKSVALELLERDPDRPKTGRPVRLTKRLFIGICHLIEAGHSVPNACRISDISYRIFRQRVQESPRLAERLKKSTDIRFEKRHEECLAVILGHAERNWIAAGWFLERTLPALYALRSVNRPDSANQTEEAEPIPKEILARHQELLLRKASEDQARRQAALPAAPIEDNAPITCQSGSVPSGDQ